MLFKGRAVSRKSRSRRSRVLVEQSHQLETLESRLLLSGVVDGDFSAGLLPGGDFDPGWHAFALASGSASASAAIVDSYAGSTDVLEMTATSTYTWQDTGGGSGYWGTDAFLFVQVYQSEMIAPAGTTGLSFNAAAQFAGASSFGVPFDSPYVLVTVQDFNGVTQQSIVDGNWGLQQIDLPNLDTSWPVSINLAIGIDIPYEPAGAPGDTLTVSVAAYFDDFAFTGAGTVNTAPVAADQSLSTDEDTPAIGAVSAADVENDPLTFSLVSGPANGALTLNTDGSFTYAPAVNFNGTDSFTYVANDGQADSNVATMTIAVSAVNDAPVAADQSLSTDEDTPSSGVVSAADVENDALMFSVVTGPSNGTLTLNTDGSFTYAPALNFSGTDSFTYVANDGQADSNVATVTITVNEVAEVNTAPVAVDQSVTVTEDGTLQITLLASDAQTAVEDLTFTITSLPASGSLTKLDGSAVAVGDVFVGAPVLAYTPGASGDGEGSDSFTFSVTDDGEPALSSSAAVSIQIVKAVADGAVSVDAAGVVRIGGGGANDVIAVSRVGDYLQVAMNGQVVGSLIPMSAVTEIRAWLRAGNDRFDLSGVNVNSEIYGGDGDDTLTGGSGSDLLIGGAGSDTVTGGSGNDLVVGGDGADRLVGSSGNDILIAASTGDALTGGDLRAALNDWARDKAVDTGDDALDETIISDDDFDMLTGSSGSDWFIIGSADKITDLKGNKSDGDLITIV